MSPASLTIRPFRDADETAVVALWQELFPDARPWNQPDVDLRRKRSVQPDLLLVGELDGAVVATVMLGYDGHRGWIYRVAVAPAMRRRKLGTAMVAAAEAQLRQLGCPKINLQILSTNRAVVAFYESLGFAVEDRVSMGKPLA